MNVDIVEESDCGESFKLSNKSTIEYFQKINKK